MNQIKKIICSCNSYQAPKYTMYKEGWGSTEVAGDISLIVFLHWDGNMKWVNHFLLKSMLILSHSWSCCLTYEYFKNILPLFFFVQGGCSGINRAFGGIKRGSVNQLLPNFRQKSIYTPVFTFWAFQAFPCLLFTKKVFFMTDFSKTLPQSHVNEAPL